MSADRWPKEGVIPFRIRIGVTGHRTLRDEEALAAAVRTVVAGIRDLIDLTATPVGLAVVSQLAEGADRLVVHQVRAEDEHAQLEVVLPLPEDFYADRQRFDATSRKEFADLLSRAVWKSEPQELDPAILDEPATAYAVAGQQLFARCDVLIGLWNGGLAGGRGGTAEILLAAAERGKPCVWIATDGEPAIVHNLKPDWIGTFLPSKKFYREVKSRAHPPVESEQRQDELEFPEQTLEPIYQAAEALEEFNSASLPRGFERRLAKELSSSEVPGDWVKGAFLRATLLARRFRRRFDWSARGIAVLGTLAAAALAASVSFEEEWGSKGAWIELGLLLALGVGVYLLHRSDWHGRWLSYRLLAERLRSAYYLAPTGVDFRRAAGFEAVFVERRSAEWLLRCVEEVWARRPPAARDSQLDDGQVESLKKWLADNWIATQIEYHEGAAKKHKRWNFVLTWTAILLFAATIPFAYAHATHKLGHWSVFLSITLPAAAASLGVLVTVRQHRALRERFGRMRTDLLAVQQALGEANRATLGKTSSEAARVIAQESGDWFGAMWFLDIEHPP
jgi:conflict system pore-forming effector with SLATT domain